MKKKPFSTFLLALSLLTLVSCGSDDDDDDLINLQLPQEEEVSNFATRVSPTLAVSGSRCEGSETTTSGGTTYNCQRDQWLISIDDVNTCTPAGACTEIGVIPFVAELDRTDRVSIPEYTFFEIDPISPVTPQQVAIINDIWVRFDLNSDKAEVIER